MALQITAGAILTAALIFCARVTCAQDIRIAVAGSMTGFLAEAGDEVKRGAERTPQFLLRRSMPKMACS